MKKITKLLVKKINIVYNNFEKQTNQNQKTQGGKANEQNRQNHCKSRERERESHILENKTSIQNYALLNIHARDG